MKWNSSTIFYYDFWINGKNISVAGLAYQNDAGGQGTSYDYQDYDNQEYDEEPQPSLIPQFEIEAQHFKVAKDRVIRLPCRVDQLGKPWYYIILIYCFCCIHRIL